MKCKQIVQKYERDSDAHGSFSRSWNEECGLPVHQEEYCTQHFKDHLRMLEGMAEHYEQRARANRAQLARLTEPTKP